MVRLFSFTPDELASMNEAKQTLESLKSDIIILETQDKFQPEVLESKIPVLLECFADWCPKCQKLAPMLEEAVLSHSGKLKLVKLDIDSLPQISDSL
jgi:thioredoxin-like negative regulator of GroEL